MGQHGKSPKKADNEEIVESLERCLSSSSVLETLENVYLGSRWNRPNSTGHGRSIPAVSTVKEYLARQLACLFCEGEENPGVPDVAMQGSRGGKDPGSKG